MRNTLVGFDQALKLSYTLMCWNWWQHFAHCKVTGKHVRIMSDNSTTVACINKQGSTKKGCNKVTRDLIMWGQRRNLTLSAAFIPGVYNIESDCESRHRNTDTECMVNDAVFAKLVQKFGKFECDIFASRLNKKIYNFVTWHPQPHAYAVDAFTINWSKTYAYCFPPFSIIARVLRKVEEDQAEVCVVVPLWTTQPWFTKMLQLLVEPPVILLRTKDCWDETVGMQIIRKNWKAKDFQRRQQTYVQTWPFRVQDP